MKLRPVDKLMLLMLCDLSKKRSERSINFNLIEKALISDNEWSLSWKEFQLTDGSDDNESVLITSQILSMYQVLYRSFLRLNREEQREVIDVCMGELPLFIGFSKEMEYEHYKIAQFFINEMGLFKELSKVLSFDSKKEMMPLYQRMLKTFNTVTHTKGYVKWLSKDGIILVVVS